MSEIVGEVGYIEVPIRETTAPKWKELTISTGAAQSTLEDIKLAERAGGYVYHESASTAYHSRNRFIYWKTNHNVLELIEESLDVNLVGNKLRLRFQHTPLLEGVSIFETQSNVVVLAATVATVHRISFPHPRKLKQDVSSRYRSTSSVPSIFFDASPAILRDYHVLNHVGVGASLSQNSCSWLGPNGEAIFILGTTTSSLFVISIDPFETGGKVSSMEIKKTTSLTRFLTGMLPNAMRGGGDGEEASLSLVCHQAEDDLFIYSLSCSLRIHMWSYRRQECLMASSVLDHCEGNFSRSAYTSSGRRSCMYKALDSHGTSLYLGVYVSLHEKSQFCVFQPVMLHGTYRLVHLMTSLAPENDLVDFCLTSSSLWTLWAKQNYEPVVCMKPYDTKGVSEHGWIGVDLQSTAPQSKATVPAVLDTAEMYIDRIFGHGAFSFSTLSKALTMCHRKGESGTQHSFSMTIRDEAISAVESEVRARAKESELEESEFLALVQSCWEHFYNTCMQYHEVGLKPLGLFVDPSSGLAAVVRKDHFSILRPCEWHERCLLSERYAAPSDCPYPECLRALVECVSEINSHLTEDSVVSITQALYHLEDPEDVAAAVGEALEGNEGFHRMLRDLLFNVRDLSASLRWLLQTFNFPEEEESKDIGDVSPNYAMLFASNTGKDFVASCVRQMIQSRFIFIQNLLLIEQLMLPTEGGEHQMPDDFAAAVGILKAETSQLVRAYYAVLWATETDSSPTTGLLEGSIRQMAISDHKDGFSVLGTSDRQTSLVEMFLREDGGEAAARMLADRFEGRVTWSEGLLAYLSLTAGMIWPFASKSTFSKMLLDQGQHLQLAEHVRLLKGWCAKNSGTRKFLYASSLLICEEKDKACNLFLGLANEVLLAEPYMQQQLRKAASTVGPFSNEAASVFYFLRVIQIFEKANLPECVVTVAEEALKVASNDNPNVPALWSLLFKHQLELGHVQQAYKAMTCNPDESRRSDCLRQLVIVLYERRELKTLTQFPSGSVQDEIVSILEVRARASDLVGHCYYSLLYALHVSAKRYRRAASALCEYSTRLGREVPGTDSLRRQLLCLRSAMNCLLLVSPQYAWIVRPDLVGSFSREEAGRSPKRDSDGDEVSRHPQRRVEVVEVSDLRKEAQLIEAWLLLVEAKETNVSPPLSPEETATLLVAGSHFDKAADICQAFNFSLDTVFEGLTAQCARRVEVVKPRGVDPQWIVEHPRTLLDVPGHAWLLLQHYLDHYESSPLSTRYHRLVASSFLARGCTLPPWFLASYKKRDPSELLRLYLMYGRLEDATSLSLEYIDAVLGKGPEYFGLRETLHATSHPVRLPHTVFDRLLMVLQASEKYAILIGQLREKLDEYFGITQQVMSTKLRQIM
ncbi:nuclear pore complex protein Nup160-like [Ornithodoros turicata]|uniref:nuclear pore complex protein Nup160-like n=1 Tax=Ornithodoros turicata TaxID=34597 RepID=UPI003139A8B4